MRGRLGEVAPNGAITNTPITNLPHAPPRLQHNPFSQVAAAIQTPVIQADPSAMGEPKLEDMTEEAIGIF